MRAMVWLAAALALAGCGEVQDLMHPSRTYQTAAKTTTCRYRDSAAAGASKVCSYDCGGPTVATSVKAGAACPTTASYP